MDEKLEILLNSEKNIESINVDNSTKIELSNKPALINEYNIRNVLSVTELFELEREENQIYRIYGSIEYLSLLNGLRSSYNDFSHFFNPRFEIPTSKSIFNSFDFYLVRPAESGYTKNILNASLYNRFFKVVATPNQFELFKAGFGKNVLNEQTYIFNFTVDVDISELRDEFGMPLTELFLYVQYKKTGLETLSFTRWSDAGAQTNPTFDTRTLSIGEYVRTQDNRNIGDYVEYAKQRFWQTQTRPQTFRIGTPIVFDEIEDESTVITLNQGSCVIAIDDFNQLGEYYREYRQTLTFSIPEPQPNDVTIFYRITTEIDGTYTTPNISSTTGSTIIFAGQTSRTLSGMVCRIEIRDDMGAGGYEDYYEYISYELITTSIGGGSSQQTNLDVIWKYNPFIPIRLRYFQDYLSRANTGSTSYEETVSIPEYATEINNGNFVWREIMPEGYRDPITGIGTDHPFVNKRRYVFTKIMLDITPDLEDENTRNLFEKLWFENDTTLIYTRPINDINELDKPCL